MCSSTTMWEMGFQLIGHSAVSCVNEWDCEGENDWKIGEVGERERVLSDKCCKE